MFFKLFVLVFVLCIVQASHYQRRLTRRNVHEDVKGPQKANTPTKGLKQENNIQKSFLDLAALSSKHFGDIKELATDAIIAQYRTGNVACDKSPINCKCVSVEFDQCKETYKSCYKTVIEVIKEYVGCDKTVGKEVKACLEKIEKDYEKISVQIKDGKCYEAIYLFKKIQADFDTCTKIMGKLHKIIIEAVANKCGKCYYDLQNQYYVLIKAFYSCNPQIQKPN